MEMEMEMTHTRTKSTLTLWLVGVCLSLSLLLPLSLSAQGRPFHVAGQMLPVALGSPSVIQGGTTNTSVTANQLFIFNSDTLAAHTFTVTDCSTPIAFTFYNATSLDASAITSLNLGGIRMQGCFKWSATGLTGTDLVIDHVLTTKVTTAGHVFVAADVGKILTITAGTGFTPGSYTIASVSAGAAIVGSAVGLIDSTGGTWSLPMMMGALTGMR